MKIYHCLLVISSLLFISVASVRASEKLITIGDEPPPFSLELRQAPPEAKLDSASLKGKLTLLEFWSTTCGPCIAAIPHINSLYEKLKGLPVQIVSVTPDTDEALATFLKKRPIKTWIGLDRDNKVANSFGIKGIPVSVIIGMDGKVAACLLPTDLNEEELRSLALGSPPTENMKKNCQYALLRFASSASRDDSKEAKLTARPPIYQIEISPGAGDGKDQGSGCSWGKRNLRVTNASLDRLIERAYSTQSCRTVINGKLPAQKYDVSIVLSQDGSNEKVFESLRQGLQEAFGLTDRWRSERSEAYLLEKLPHSKVQLTRTASTGAKYCGNDGHRFQFVNCSLTEVAAALESHLSKPVISSVSDKDNLDISIPFDAKAGAGELNDGLAQLGLRLRPAKKSIKLLIIDLPEPKTGEKESQ